MQRNISTLVYPAQAHRRNRWLAQTGVLLSAICLAAVFYTTGTGNLFSTSAAPEPLPQTPQTAAGGGGSTTANKTASVSDIVTKALAFKALLSTSQQASLQLTYSASAARKWSNLPCGSGCRNGVQFSTFSAAQLQAAKDLIKASLGNTTGDGYDEFLGNYYSEAYLHANGGGNGYDTTVRFIAFLNTPSATGSWMLQFGGHHYAANIAFNNGHIVGATPFFEGLEPKTFTYNGTYYAPLDDEKNAFGAMLASLSSTQLATAKLSQSFSDCVMSPGETNGGTATFPAAAQGIACSTLSSAQQALVQAAINRYVEDLDATTAAAINAVYAAELNSTYISWRGSGTAGTASSFLVAQGDYVRISGPTVWIEFSCQGGIVIQGQIHYHTIWRDRSHDYGVDLNGPAIDVPLAVSNVATPTAIDVYPNPTSGQLSMTLPTELKSGTLQVLNLTGQLVKTQPVTGSSVKVDVSELPTGTYLLRISDASGNYSARFAKQ